MQTHPQQNEMHDPLPVSVGRRLEHCNEACGGDPWPHRPACIITGVVFYVVMSIGGILILAPALLLTSPGVPAEPHLAEALQ